MYTRKSSIFCVVMKKLTPAQQQYMDMKRQHPDCVLLFRLGDFYEVFYEDAHIAHRVLGITLTARNKESPDPIPMAGIPHHALERYLPVLIQAGYKVALADQVGEVIPGKLVERKITQIITPGTRVEEWTLATHIVALVQYPEHRALARGDATLWVWTTRLCRSREEMLQAMMNLSPREIICDGSVHEVSYIERRARDHLQSIVSLIPCVPDADQWLLHTLWVRSLEGYGAALQPDVREACAALFWYLIQMHYPLCVRRIESWQQHAYVLLDALTIKNLEIFQWSYQGNKKQSLFGVINTCSTSMWARLLADKLSHPIQNRELISAQHNHISYRVDCMQDASKIHALLQVLRDIPRLALQITQRKRMIMWLRQLAEQVQQLHVHEQVREALARYDRDVVEHVDLFTKHLVTLIQEQLPDEADWMQDWQDGEVDRLRHIDDLVENKLLSYQQARQDRTWVSVKVKFITNQGYSLEVTPKDIHKFEAATDPQDPLWGAVRGQTLKTGQRYLTAYLQEIQAEIAHAKEALYTYHAEQANKLFAKWQTESTYLYAYADIVAQLDLHTSMAILLHEQSRCLPQMQQQGDLQIVWWRHPVVEAYLPKEEQFIANDTTCGSDNFFHLITWPNMGGKSTYMRQQALIILLAHAWLPVPATRAHIPLVDWIFARIWSGDLLAKQQSTFMTEMIETAAILHNATHRSFVVIDELWRWTSTSDGLALAKAIVVYICHWIQAKTLFATHYHELIALEWVVPWVQNWHVGVYETEHEVIFLKKICLWGADKSYWLDVAKLAWIPSWVLSLAEEYLQEDTQRPQKGSVQQTSLFASGSLWSQSDKRFDELSAVYGWLDVYTITPLEALAILQQIVLKLSK